MSAKRWIVVAMLPASIGLHGCSGEVAQEVIPARSVVVTSASVRDFEEQIEATGELLAKNRATVAAQVEGEITGVLHDEGDAVEAGSVVIEIDPERRELELARARAHVAEARAAVLEQERELSRMQKLLERDVAARSRLEQSETAVQAARSRLLAAQAERGVSERALRDASVPARFDGLIGRRVVSVGEFVKPGQPLFELVSLKPVEVAFHLPEADSSRVQPGQPIEITVAPYPDEVFRATVSVISPTIDPRTRTLRVKALIPNEDGRLRPGLFARADLGVDHRKDVLMVPEEAVLQRSDGAVVFRVEDGNRVKRRVVELGIIRAGWVEILDGIDPGDAIVLRGHADLIDGSLIVPRNPDGTDVISEDSLQSGTPVVKR